MGIGKSGFFFTFIALLLSSIFMVAYSNMSVEQPVTTLAGDTAKIEVVARFTENLKTVFLSRALLSSSNKALETALEEMQAADSAIDDPEAVLEELVVNGTMYSIFRANMLNNTLKNWSTKITALADEHFDIVANITFHSVEVYQPSPWHITFKAKADIHTNTTHASFEIIDEPIVSNLSIEGFNDPLFLLNQSERKIERNTNAIWNLTHLKTHIRDGTFTHHPNAPSFLMRMQADNSSSPCCGIESVLNASITNSDDINYSYVDYLHWNKTWRCDAPAPYYSLFNITGISDQDEYRYLKLDLPHLDWYLAGNISYLIASGNITNACS